MAIKKLTKKEYVQKESIGFLNFMYNNWIGLGIGFILSVILICICYTVIGVFII